MPEEIHQPATEQVTNSPVITPRADDPPIQPGDDTTEGKAALEAKERLTKTKGFWDRIAPPKEEKEETPEPEEKEPKPDKKEKAAQEPEEKEEKPEAKAEKKPRGKKKETEVDPIEIAQAVGREIARETAKSAKAEPPPPPAAEPVELPEEFRRDTAVFEEMARLNPKRYGKIKDELARYTKAENDYIAKWEAEHPNEEFDGDSDEHDAFYAKVKPDYDRTDFEAAKESLIEQRITRKAEERVEERMRQREIENEKRREQTSQIKPEVETEMFGILGKMIEATDPDNADLAKDWKSIQELDQKNPLLADVMVQVHNETKPMMEATKRLFRGVDKPDPQNPAHAAVFNLISLAEQEIARMPVRERYDDSGRLFATQEDYARMTPAEKAKHWYIDEQYTTEIVRGRAIGRTKSIYEHEAQRIARYTKGAGATQKSNNGSQPTHSNATPPRTDHRSPSVSGRGTLPSDGKPATNQPESGVDLFFRRHLTP